MSNFLAKSFVWVTLSEIIYNLSGYIIHAVAGRILGPADYGLFGIVITLTTMTIVLLGQSIPTAMSKYLSEIFEKKKYLVEEIKKQTIQIQTTIVVLATIIFFLISPLLARALGDPKLTQLFQLSSLVIPAFAMASFYFYYYTGLHKFKIQAFLKTSRGIFRLIFIIGLALFFKPYNWALQGAILGYVAAPFVIFLLGWGIDKIKVAREFKVLPPKVKKPHAEFDWKKLATFAWPVTIFLIAYQLLNTIDLYLVKGILHSDAKTGFYNAAYTVGTIPYNLFYALTIILLPAVSKLTYVRDKSETKKVISQSLRFLVMFLVPTCLLMSYFSLPTIVFFYSARFAPAAPVMSIYVIAEGFLTVFYVLTFILNGAGKVKIPMYASLVGLFLNTVLAYFLIKAYGLIGAASGTAVMALAIMLFSLVYTYREFGYIFPIKSFAKIILASVIMFPVAFIFSRESSLFLLWSVILLAFYLFVLYLLKEIKKEDWKILSGILRRKKYQDPAV